MRNGGLNETNSHSIYSHFQGNTNRKRTMTLTTNARHNSEITSGTSLFNKSISTLIEPLLFANDPLNRIYHLKLGNNVTKHLNLSLLLKLFNTAYHRCLVDVANADCHKIIANNLSIDIETLVKSIQNVDIPLRMQLEFDIIFEKLLYCGELNVVNAMLYMIPQFSMDHVDIDSFNSL